MGLGAWEFPHEPADVDICICSYRRPELLETLRAISHQIGSTQARIRVIVADNTQEAAAQTLVRDAAKELPLNIHYMHAPADNISIARNACLDAARARWLAFIDDDELPVAGWLGALLDEALCGNWDAVLGPVIALYPPSAPRWLRQGNFHSTVPVWRRGRIAAGYTGNVLLRRSLVQRHALRFRIALGTTGGEDDDFFSRFCDVGGQLGFASRAVCYERVSCERASLAWLLRRNFRAGQSHGRKLDRRRKKSMHLLFALAKAGFCAVAGTLTLSNAVRGRRYLVRAALHGGVAARLAGLAEIPTRVA